MKLLLVITAISLTIPHTLSITRTYNLEVSYGEAAPDNYVQPNALLINGKFFGPTIRANRYDHLTIHVTNRLNHGFTIHWHGLHMKTTRRWDGVEGVTQQGIEPGRTFTYEIDINEQDGTFIYHAHTQMDILWAFGLLLIDDSDILAQHREYRYDEERCVVISQNWHNNSDVIYNQVISRNFTGLSTGDSILMNGRSFGVWNQNFIPRVRNRDIGYEVINVERNKVYRFRFVNIGDNTAFNCTIEGHKMTVIESDETITNPVDIPYLQIDTAQRYSVLVRTNRRPGNYIIKCNCMPMAGPDNGVAILHYKGASDPTPLRTIPRPGQTPDSPLNDWVLHELPPSELVRQKSVYPIPTKVDREILIDIYDVMMNSFFRFTLNDLHYQSQQINLLKQYQSGVNITRYPLVYSVDVGQVVQIVFQNNFLITGRCLEHPFHVHGHSFFVVGYGENKYDARSARRKINTNIRDKRYQFRDVTTVTINRTNDNALPCGWVAIRFIANNPGVWIIHCHVTYHMILGMQFVLVVNEFKCTTAGRFPDPVDCNIYYECIYDGRSLSRKKFNCKSGFAYDETRNKCRSARTFVTRCSRTGIEQQ